MKKRILMGCITILLFMVSMVVTTQATTLYAVSGSGGTLSALYTVDAASGTTTFIGNTGYAINSLSYYDGTLYATERQGGSLLTVDMATGTTTAIGSSLGTNITSFAINSTGAFGWSESGTDSLYSINLLTGSTTIIIGPEMDSASHGMAFVDDVLYFYNWDGYVYTIDTTTGAQTLVGDTGFERHGVHGSYNMDNELYYSLYRDGRGGWTQMFTTTLVTATEVGSAITLDRALHALAFDSEEVGAPVPEPATMLLFGLGLLGLAGVNRRKK